MTDSVKEQLSACLDGELPPGELDLLLKRLERDPELRGALGRYALLGETLRGRQPVAASRGFADKVAAALDAEPAMTPAVSPAVMPAAKVARRGFGSAAFAKWLQPAAGTPALSARQTSRHTREWAIGDGLAAALMKLAQINCAFRTRLRPKR